MYGAILLLHVLGATIWVGGHLVLAIAFLPAALRARDPALVLGFERRYERIGMPSLVVQVLTGAWLAWRLVPDPVAWFTFDGTIPSLIGIKLTLLLATLLLAVSARTRVLPNLHAGNLPLLAWHVAGVTLFSVLFAAAGVGIRIGGWW